MILMIGKDVARDKHKRSSFFYLNKYILSGDKSAGDKLAYAGTVNLAATENLKLAAWEMTATAELNKKVKEPVRHFLLSWREGEVPTPLQIQQAVSITLKELGLENNQCLYGLHKNTDNFHLHISVNTVDPNTLKAVQPNNGFTIKAMERAARKIEKEQGWEIEKNAWSEIDEAGICHERRSALHNEDKSIPQKVRDKEIRNGEKSIIRLAQEELLPLISDAQNWKHLHYRLANAGAEYMIKGSGAIIKFGDTVIKASSVSKKCTLKSLENKFGKFVSREDVGAVINPARDNKPISFPIKEAKNEQINPEWEEYNLLRYAYKEKKKELTQAFYNHAKRERNILKETQKAARAEEFKKGKWKGKGKLLNLLKSTYAQKQKGERLDLEDNLKERKKQMLNEFPRFPTFEEWLKNKNLAAAACDWRYKKEMFDTNLNTVSGYPNKYVKPECNDIRSFVAVANAERGEVTYYDKMHTNYAAFIDRGKSLLMQTTNEKNILAALQLAQQKWGKVKLSGSDDYINKCIELAAKHNIQISNPELQDKYKSAQERERKMQREAVYQKQLDGMRTYINAVVPERIHATATEFFEDGNKRGFVVNKKDGYIDGYTPEELENNMKRLVNLQRAGRNIFYTPVSENKYHLLVDDLTAEAVFEMQDAGYKPAIIIESSTGNYQAILTVDKLGTEYDREIGNRLVRELNQKYGDPKVSGEIHAHRAPGFDNRKPKHKKEDGTYPEVKIIQARGGQCEKCTKRIIELRQIIAEEERNRPQLNIKQAADPNSAAAYMAHFNSILNLWKKKGVDKNSVDASRLDSQIAIRLRATGHTYEDIYNAIIDMAPQARQIIGSTGNHNWTMYAQRTTDYAFSARGDMQIEKYASSIDRWKRIEPKTQEKTEGR